MVRVNWCLSNTNVDWLNACLITYGISVFSSPWQVRIYPAHVKFSIQETLSVESAYQMKPFLFLSSFVTSKYCDIKESTNSTNEVIPPCNLECMRLNKFLKLKMHWMITDKIVKLQQCLKFQVTSISSPWSCFGNSIFSSQSR